MRSFFPVLIFSALLVLPGLAGPLDDPLDETAVRGEFVERLRATGVFTSVRSLPDGTVETEWAEDGKGNNYLGNLMLSLQNAPPEERDAIIERHVTSAVESAKMDNLDLATANLMLTVYPESYIRSVSELSQSSDNPVSFEEAMQPRRHVAGELWQVIVHDTPSSVSQVNAETVRSFGLTADVAWQIAHENLDRRAEPLELAEGEDFWVLQLDTYYENAVMLLPDRWPLIAEMIGGRPVVVSPARGWVFIARSDKPAEIARIRSLATEFHAAEAHPISTQLYRWTGDGWEVLAD